MRKRNWFVAAVIAGAALAGAAGLGGASAPVLRQEDKPQSAAAKETGFTLDDLRWIAGDWRGTYGEDSIVEESWREPIGDAMLGTFRWVTKGKTRFYEIIVIEQDAPPGGPVMRLKHFNPGLKGWEEKDECLAWALVEAKDGRAVFRRGEGEHAGDIVMERRGEDGLYIGVDVERNGEKSVLEFNFTRYEP